MNKALLTSCLTALSLLGRRHLADGHGYLSSPRSRNLLAFEELVWWPQTESDPEPETCPHCLNRGGTLARCGMVGDPSGGVRNYDAPKNALGGRMPTNVQATYVQGQNAVLNVTLTAHHKGHFVFSACPISSPDEIPTQECFDRHRLTFLSDMIHGANYDPDHPERAYIAPVTDAPDYKPDLGSTRSVMDYSFNMLLPPELHGDLVLLQWYYLTANSCYHEGYQRYDWPSAWNIDATSMGPCGDVSPDGNGVPEQFWNCAEVRILRGGGADADADADDQETVVGNAAPPQEVAVGTPPPSLEPTPKPSPEPTPMPTTRKPTAMEMSSGIAIPVGLPSLGASDNTSPYSSAGDHGKTIVGYYASWQWYDRQKKAAPENMDFTKVQRVNFAFFQIDVQGQMWGTDSWADPNLLFGPYNWNPSPETRQYCSWDAPNAKACNYHDYERGLIHLVHAAGAEIYPSLGGWTLSDPFPAMAASASARATFALNCVRLIQEYGFDGIDIDWEYPGYEDHSGTPRDRDNFKLLLDDVRAKLDELGAQTGRFYGLTAALPCGPRHIGNMDIQHVASTLSELNLMTYDFHGAFSETSGVNAPMYYQGWGEEDFNLHSCVQNWLAGGGSRDKINIGLPFYGRSVGLATGLDQPHNGADMSAWSLDEGTPQYFNIAAQLPSMTTVWDKTTWTPYAYFENGGFVSFDDENAICVKVQYAIENELGGFIIWELSGDLMEDFSTPLLDITNKKLRNPDLYCGEPGIYPEAAEETGIPTTPIASIVVGQEAPPMPTPTDPIIIPGPATASTPLVPAVDHQVSSPDNLTPTAPTPDKFPSVGTTISSTPAVCQVGTILQSFDFEDNAVALSLTRGADRPWSYDRRPGVACSGISSLTAGLGGGIDTVSILSITAPPGTTHMTYFYSYGSSLDSGNDFHVLVNDALVNNYERGAGETCASACIFLSEGDVVKFRCASGICTIDNVQFYGTEETLPTPNFPTITGVPGKAPTDTNPVSYPDNLSPTLPTHTFPTILMPSPANPTGSAATPAFPTGSNQVTSIDNIKPTLPTNSFPSILVPVSSPESPTPSDPALQSLNSQTVDDQQVNHQPKLFLCGDQQGAFNQADSTTLDLTYRYELRTKLAVSALASVKEFENAMLNGVAEKLNCAEESSSVLRMLRINRIGSSQENVMAIESTQLDTPEDNIPCSIPVNLDPITTKCLSVIGSLTAHFEKGTSVTILNKVSEELLFYIRTSMASGIYESENVRRVVFIEALNANLVQSNTVPLNAPANEGGTSTSSTVAIVLSSLIVTLSAFTVFVFTSSKKILASRHAEEHVLIAGKKSDDSASTMMPRANSTEESLERAFGAEEVWRDAMNTYKDKQMIPDADSDEENALGPTRGAPLAGIEKSKKQSESRKRHDSTSVKSNHAEDSDSIGERDDDSNGNKPPGRADRGMPRTGIENFEEQHDLAGRSCKLDNARQDTQEMKEGARAWQQEDTSPARTDTDADGATMTAPTSKALRRSARQERKSAKREARAARKEARKAARNADAKPNHIEDFDIVRVRSGERFDAKDDQLSTESGNERELDTASNEKKDKKDEVPLSKTTEEDHNEIGSNVSKDDSPPSSDSEQGAASSSEESNKQGESMNGKDNDEGQRSTSDEEDDLD